MSETKTPVAPQKQDTTLAKKELSQSERFTQAVIKQFTDTAGELQLTNFQKSLTKNYFIKLDQVLKAAEQKRLAKDEKWRDPLALNWNNVNMQKLAVDVVAYSGVGLDPIQPNHINIIPYKNNHTKQYDIVFITGYKGKEIKGRKYGLDVPDDVVVELVYATDKFIQIKKDLNNKVEGYTLEVTDNFNRGAVVGGFYYYKWFNQPEKNKLKVFSMADIMKRKPDSASPEFWGGEKDEWKDGKKTGKKVVVEGWAEEMYYKTIYSAAWGNITIDASKIDDNYQAVIKLERETVDSKVFQEIKEKANKGEQITFEETIADEVPEVTEEQLPESTEQPLDINNEQTGPSF